LGAELHRSSADADSGGESFAAFESLPDFKADRGNDQRGLTDSAQAFSAALPQTPPFVPGENEERRQYKSDAALHSVRFRQPVYPAADSSSFSKFPTPFSQPPLRRASTAPEPRSSESIFAAIRLPEPQKQTGQDSAPATSFNTQWAEGVEVLWPDLPVDPGP
jgi:hypothetical protein